MELIVTVIDSDSDNFKIKQMDIVDWYTNSSIYSGLTAAIFIVTAIFLSKIIHDSTDSTTTSTATYLDVVTILVGLVIFGYFIFNIGSVIVLTKTPQGRGVVKLSKMMGGVQA